MTEPDVALTDFALAAEATIFAWRAKPAPRPLGPWPWRMIFAATAVAAACGGLFHGFVLDAASPFHAPLWAMTLLALAATAAAMLLVAIDRLGGPTNRLIAPSVGAVALFGAFVFARPAPFLLAIAAYFPAAVLLGIAFLRGGDRAGRLGAGAMLLTLLGGVAQQLRLTLLPSLLTHNAFFHVVQMVALYWLFLSGGGTAGQPRGESSP